MVEVPQASGGRVAEAPKISVIVPTHDRFAMLARTLTALGRQTIPATAYEVVVVADGSSDDAVGAIRRLGLPYTVVALAQPHAGAAAARNRGAARARAPLLLFLDDDMEASPDLLAAHLAVHAAGPGDAIVLGNIPSAADGPPADLCTVETRLWWRSRMRAWEDPAHRFTAHDVFTGNVSMSRALFEAVGGFDAAFAGAAGEDLELGFRLLGRHVPIRFARAAAARHHDRPTVARMLARAEAEGRGHVVVARRHPAAVLTLPLATPVAGRIAKPLAALGWRWPRLVRLLTAAARHALLPLLDRGRFRRLHARVAHHLRREAYWQGVRDLVGNVAALDALRASAREAPTCERDVDLAAGLPALERLLAAEPIDGLRLLWGDAEIGRLAPRPASEPLRPAHVHAALVGDLATAVLPFLTHDS